MHQCRKQSQADADPPHHVIGFGDVIAASCKPQSGERAELVREKHKAEQHRHPLRAEKQRDEARGQRHGRQPEEAEQCRDANDHPRGDGDEEETQKRENAHEIDERQALAPFNELAGLAGNVGADQIGDTDRHQRPDGNPGLHAFVGRKGRQMHRVERDMEPADKESGDQQPETRMRKGFRKRLPQSL